MAPGVGLSTVVMGVLATVSLLLVMRGAGVYVQSSPTSTWFLFGTLIGLATLFGHSFHLGGAWAPSIRIWWHFVTATQHRDVLIGEEGT